MTRDNVELMQDLLTAGQNGDMERLRELTHEDCVVDEPESLPYGGEYTGETAFPDIFADIAGTWDAFDFEGPDIWDAGEKVFVLWQVEAEASGGVVEQPLMEVYEIEDDKIVRADIFYKDTAAILEAVEA